ncbi:hypothetical protein PLESTB_001564400 [Pleodorina starrii]|uniref:Uncharacterized protein n=1 Tax=Pleodorina starrii TaxID=330485 RepID=A0A9W6BY65_9CHLO|nr:hypothetical protein PLESTM_001480200 [Pleodorina starrii]GLC60020.1 hypothetical protein PLESTB_001564400 [Pleodorina starrii]GLC72753.1 hypothetical protein PLESTF_001289700 [Pleodorina starrii]
MLTPGQRCARCGFRRRPADTSSCLLSRCGQVKSDNAALHVRQIQRTRLNRLSAARPSAPSPTPSSPATPAAAAAAGASIPPAPWSESTLWEEAIQAACGEDPAARAALGRSLQGLYTLLPDLLPHWRQQLVVHQRLVDIEALICGKPPQRPTALPTESATSATAAASAGDDTAGADADAGPSSTCMFAAAQQAFTELQSMKSFFKSYGTRTTTLYHSRSLWVLSDVLMRAPASFSGPGAPLLRSADLGQAGAELRALRRSHREHLTRLVQAQLDLSRRLPDLARLLVALRQERPETSVDVGRKVATNLLLLQQSFADSHTLDRLSLILEMEAQESWRRAAKGH